MAHTRKDTLTRPPEWWKHLRPFNKRRVAKRERKAAVKEIEIRKANGIARGATPLFNCMEYQFERTCILI
jgi:hypothetical protein